MKTLTKIAIARLASRLIVALRSPAGLSGRVVCRRGGIVWDLDLAQGIDLAIYLLGAFEPAVTAASRRLCREGGVFLDIGANLGAHTLPLATFAGPHGKVYAFEPTRFAFAKLERNISLNPELAKRIEVSQVFLGNHKCSFLPESVPASWPLDGQSGLDPLHGGRGEALDGCRHDTLDAWMERTNPIRVDLIKMDVDGNEIDILSGADRLLRIHRPVMLAEFAPYVFAGKPGGFGRLVEMLRDHGYTARTLRGKSLPLDAGVEAFIPAGAGVNVILTPRVR